MATTIKTTHYHRFIEHPNPEMASLMVCEICGLAVPKRLLAYCLDHGATIFRAPLEVASFRRHAAADETHPTAESSAQGLRTKWEPPRLCPGSRPVAARLELVRLPGGTRRLPTEPAARE